MTCRRGGESSGCRREIGKDERQPEMARLAARWRRSNLAKLVTPRKGNHPAEAKIKSRKKAFYRRERDSLEGRHEEAEIQRKTLRRGKNLALSKDTCLEKKRVRSKMTPRKLVWD